MSECQGEWDEGISYKFSKRGPAITHPRSVDGCKEHCRSIAQKFYCLSLALFRFIARFSVRSRTLRCFFPQFVRVNNELQSSLFIQSHGSIDTPFSMRPAAGCLFVNYESEWIIRVGVVDVCDAICSSILTSSFLAAVWVDSPIAANDVQSDWAQSHSAFAPSILHSRNSSAFSISDSSFKASPKGERIWWRRQLVCSHVTRSAERCFSLIFSGHERKTHNFVLSSLFDAAEGSLRVRVILGRCEITFVIQSPCHLETRETAEKLWRFHLFANFIGNYLNSIRKTCARRTQIPEPTFSTRAADFAKSFLVWIARTPAKVLCREML